MDFIERLLGISPDGGNGSLELAFWLIPFLLLAFTTWWKMTAKNKRSDK